jgi:hypothetical protein
MKDRFVRDLLEIRQSWDGSEKINGIEKRIARLERALFVRNYFEDCPCCSTDSMILRQEAVSFQKRSAYYDGYAPVTYWTTKESYEIHKKAIEQWEKELKTN